MGNISAAARATDLIRTARVMAGQALGGKHEGVDLGTRYTGLSCNGCRARELAERKSPVESSAMRLCPARKWWVCASR